MKELLRKHLNNDDYVDLLTLSHRSLACNDILSMKELLRDLGKLFLFDTVKLAHAHLPSAFSNPEPDIKMVDINYPADFWDLYVRKKFFFTDVMLADFLISLEPVHWRTVHKRLGDSPASLAALEYKLDDAWEYGTIDPGTQDGTILFLGGPKLDGSKRVRIILEYLTPFLSAAYQRVLKNIKIQVSNLTPREIEVLNWVKEGKSSWEISVILNCSKRTIDFHIKNIKTKINAMTRAQAVAIGLQRGIISF